MVGVEYQAGWQLHSSRGQGGPGKERMLGARRAYRGVALIDSVRHGAPRAAHKRRTLICSFLTCQRHLCEIAARSALRKQKEARSIPGLGSDSD